jgi:predicted nuclease of predicted toxin-antitoxin system
LRFLVDRCAGQRLAESLRADGHDVVDVREWGADPGDRQILMRAVEENRILVTMDKDFGLLVFARGERHRGLVRLPDVPAARRIGLLRDVLTRHAADLEAGAVITVRGERIRVSRPPHEFSDRSRR